MDGSNKLTRRGFAVTSLAAGFAMTAGPLNAQSIITTDAQGLTVGEIQIPVAGGNMPAYRAKPERGANFPIVLVVHEAWGVHEHIRDVARRFAKLGYQAVAPELFARYGDASRMDQATRNSQIMSRQPDAEVMGDLDAAAAWAATDGGDANRLAITGFCWGGRVVWLYAAHNPRLKTGVAWYGRLVGQTTQLQPAHPIDLVDRINAPILGLYGAADTGIPLDTVGRMTDALLTARKPSQIIVYPNTPHGFHADYRDSYRPGPARDGWERLQAWFRRHGAAPNA